MNLGDLTERCRRRFRDLGNVFVLDETWHDHINASLGEFRQAARWPFQLTTSTKTLAAGAHSVQLTQGELEFLDDIYDVTGDRSLRPLPDVGSNTGHVPGNERLSLRDYLFLQHQDSEPIFYQLDGDTLFIMPAPRLNDHEIRIFFYDQDPALLVLLTDEPNVPVRYHDALVSGACAKAALDDANVELATGYRKEFIAVLQQAYDELRPKSTLRLDLDRKHAEIEAIRSGGAAR